MLNADMATKEIARVVGSSSRSIKNRSHRFQATVYTENLPGRIHSYSGQALRIGIA
jgi:hypothetical protein